MTLKQSNLIKEVKKSDLREDTLKDIGQRAGYSFKARNMYRKNTKKHIQQALREMGYDRESLKKRFELGCQMAIQKGDITNYLRANEDITRIQGEFKDKAELKVEEIKPDLLDITKRLSVTN